jgi:hypothetical protein
VHSVRILAAGTCDHPVFDEPPPLKFLMQEAAGTPVRRVGRFVQLALIGAKRCVGGRALPTTTATYFTSARGDLGVTLDVLVHMCRDGQSPSPFAFINTVGNSACFHVAKCFGLSGRSQFVTSRYAPLEAALRLAALDMAEGGVTMALCGSTDICTSPLAEHRERIGVPADTPLGEASHWLLLAAGDVATPPLGILRTIRSFPDDASLCRHLERLRFDPVLTAIASGQHLGLDRMEVIRKAAGIERVFDYRSDLPWYDSQTGSGLHRFLTAPVADTLVHVDGDPSGRCTLLVVEAAHT